MAALHSLLSWGTAGAGPRAEPSFVSLGLVVADEELFAAGLTDRTVRSSSRPIGTDDELLAISDATLPAGIACVAGGNEILGGIVESVVVEMICDKGSSGALRPAHPFDRSPAPVTSVWSPTDPVEENGASLCDQSGPARQRVARLIPDPPVANDVFAPPCVGAFFGAVESDLRRRPLVGRSASVAISLHG